MTTRQMNVWESEAAGMSERERELLAEARFNDSIKDQAPLWRGIGIGMLLGGAIVLLIWLGVRLWN